jgi:succinoglycan biosynthesis protein ExoM
MREHVTDIVVGPVRPAFPPGIAVPAYARRIYERDARSATGQAIEWSGIGNSLLRRDRCFAAAVPFDPQFGLSGGEDTIFLARLRERGRRLVWCAEAVVTEDIPADKLTPSYLLRRAFRSGQTTAFLPSALARPRWGAVLRWMLVGAAQMCVYGVGSIAQISIGGLHPVTLRNSSHLT